MRELPSVYNITWEEYHIIHHTAFLISELPAVSGLGIGQMGIFFPVNRL